MLPRNRYWLRLSKGAKECSPRPVLIKASPYQLGGMGSAVSSPSGVRGGALAEIELRAF